MNERYANFTKRYHQATKRTRRVMMLLAARALELETGSLPTSPSALVSGVLTAIPIDPETGAPFTSIKSEGAD